MLAACWESGALQAFALVAELAALADGKVFAAAEVCAHAVLPENARLCDAIEAECGEVSPRKLGKFLARWQGKHLAWLRVTAAGQEDLGILWRVSNAKPIPASATDVSRGK